MQEGLSQTKKAASEFKRAAIATGGVIGGSAAPYVLPALAAQGAQQMALYCLGAPSSFLCHPITYLATAVQAQNIAHGVYTATQYSSIASGAAMGSGAVLFLFLAGEYTLSYLKNNDMATENPAEAKKENAQDKANLYAEKAAPSFFKHDTQASSGLTPPNLTQLGRPRSQSLA